MVASRTRQTGVVLSLQFWLSVTCAALTPTSVGCQDLAALFARHLGVAGRWPDHLIASPFGTIHPATLAFSHPLGAAIQRQVGARPVNFDPRSLDVKVWFSDEQPVVRPVLEIPYPSVSRRLKGDRLKRPAAPVTGRESLPHLKPIDASPPQPPHPLLPSSPRLRNAEDGDSAPPRAALLDAPDDAFGLQADYDAAVIDEPPAVRATARSEPLTESESPFATLSFSEKDARERKTLLYFGAAAMGSRVGLEQWAPGAEPILASPDVDPDIKLSALQGPADSTDPSTSGETVAGKDDSRFKSPADRLGLSGKPRAKAEKCLADAVYFEARGEPPRGQEAVAQVVMNRVFSGYYPNDVCGVVYQNASRHLACQFTFACEGKDLSRIDEPDMWEQAKRIAKETLDGKIWLTEVGHATHYHAYWVHPSWVNEMAKLYHLGVHTFYRPRAWGDGSDAPVWGNVPVSSKPDAAAEEKPQPGKDTAAKGREGERKMPEAAAAPSGPAAKNEATAKL
jgi:spore germination cell wall hydrolase CwlJ-like protein